MKEILEKYVGKGGVVFAGGMTVDVEIKDVKNSYGKNRFLVTPISGKGEVWVEAVTLKLK